MKTVFIKQEGVKMNSRNDFGDASSIVHEFDYLMATAETMWDIKIKYFYRVTDDSYIQLAYKQDDSELKIIAQYKSGGEDIKENLFFILRKTFEANFLYNGFPTFENSTVLTKLEFNSIITQMKDEIYGLRKLASELKTPLIRYLEGIHLNPRPTGETKYAWIASCPNAKGKHHIMVSTKYDEWGCGYCGKKGKKEDLDNWLRELGYKRN
jgi:hypothetical protein